MLIKYRMYANTTITTFSSDIKGLIDGTITSVSGLSAGCDKANTTMTGTYPAGIYTKVNDSSNTFSKIHGTDSGYTHYFRLTYDSSKMTTFTLAQSYTSGTDTLLNSVAQTVNVTPNTYNGSEQFPKGLNIVITSKCLYFSSITSGIGFGLFDLGNNGITSTYASQMKMAYIKLTNGTFNVPYAYNLQGAASGYSSISGNLWTTYVPPTFASNATGSLVVVENPAFIAANTQGYQAFGVNNLMRIPDYGYVIDSVYNTSGTSRLAANNYAIITE
jgi:hypothetical protein